MKAYTGLQHEEWLEFRKQIITATEASIILGLDPWGSIPDMQREKEKSTFTGNAYTWVGSVLEPVVVSATNKLMNKNFELYEDPSGGKTIFADLNIGIGATPDARNANELLECKTTGTKNWYKWDSFPPLKYLCQLQVQLLCTDVKIGYLSIMCTDMQQYGPNLNLKLSAFKVKRSDMFSKNLIEQVERYHKTIKEGKQFRVNRKVAALLKLCLLQSYQKVI